MPITSRRTTMRSPPSHERSTARRLPSCAVSSIPFGVKLDEPNIELPLARYHVATRSRMPNEISGSRRADVARLRHEPCASLSARRALMFGDGGLPAGRMASRTFRSSATRTAIELNGSTLSAQERQCRANRSDVDVAAGTSRERFPEHASAGIDARADREFFSPSHTIRTRRSC